jgi:hypothetical protein
MSDQTKKYTAEQLVNVGGSLWEKGAMRRVYFNDLIELFGLNVSRYNSGNISSASLNGEGISNSRAREIISSLSTGKFYYDLNSNEFQGSFYRCRDYSAQDFISILSSKIEEATYVC